MSLIYLLCAGSVTLCRSCLSSDAVLVFDVEKQTDVGSA